GFNIFISGPPGSGRNTAIRAYVDRIAADKPNPLDWGYVHNFDDPTQPKAISLPCGMMRVLLQDMEELVGTCRREIPRAFESDDYTHRVEDALKEVQAQTKAMTDELDQRARDAGFALRQTQTGIAPVPIADGQPIAAEQIAALSKEEMEGLKERAEKIQHDIGHTTTELKRLGKVAVERAREVDTEVVRFTLTPIVDELQDKYADYQEIVEYLGRVEADMAERREIFKPAEEEAPSPIPGFPDRGVEDDQFARYRVNDVVDNTGCVGGPVVFEYSPTYYNLFGRIEYRAQAGTFNTDLTMIRCGSLHRANGGYLVLQARDLLTSSLSWETLKRTLRSRELQIENIGEQYSALPSSTLRPEPIPVNARIILVGTPGLLRNLQAFDEDFKRYFKVAAEFDSIMERTPENLIKYASFVAARCQQNKLRPFHSSAVARIVDHSSRLVEHQGKLTTRFMDVSQIVTEADFWAGKHGADVVKGEHVKEAIDEARYRAGLTEDRLREMIEDGSIHIDTDGEVVGQINGLAVLSLGDHAFGKPGRITARVSLGRGQLLNIEREARMSGRIHDKGFVILTGYIQGKYGQKRPLSLQASIGFEQSYGEIDGDSASSTELYALLSQLSGKPLAQGIAVTGSVNQNGEVQAIGGANYKIEGFFDVCKAKGITGKQGVMIPRDNIQNLALRDDVVEAVQAGQFTIYGVGTIDEGIEVLTGVPAGELQEDGNYPEGTVHHLVEERLEEMAERARDFGKGKGKGSEDDDEDQDEEDSSK
ncbi:MAG: AAA family ATPase, partial [Candidatus Latescibacteria bacterium]|nr:AAA family ATPase [Candidatus Latescibacterota bacterium]